MFAWEILSSCMLDLEALVYLIIFLFGFFLSIIIYIYNTAMVGGETRVDGSDSGDQKRDGQRARG